MIQPHELRIGNWAMANIIAFYSREGDPKTAFVQIKKGSEIGKSDLLSPVHLTAEILEKAGFNKVRNILYLNIQSEHLSDYVSIEYNAGTMECHFWADGVRVGKELKYVHEVQNLYFALTGEELTINL